MRNHAEALCKILNQDIIFDYSLGKTRVPFPLSIDCVTFPTFHYYLPNLHGYVKAQTAVTAFFC